MSDQDAVFETIIESAISEAQDITCTPDEYIEHLQGWVEVVQVEIQAMKESM